MVRKKLQLHRNKLKRLIVKSGFYVLGRACSSVSRFDVQVREELDAWNDGFCFEMCVKNTDLKLCMCKKNGRLTTAKCVQNSNLVIELKTLNTAFDMITARAGSHIAYANRKIGVKGYIHDSLILIRILNIVQAYLFPAFLHKNIFKEKIKLNLGQQLLRLRVYTTGLILGY